MSEVLVSPEPSTAIVKLQRALQPNHAGHAVLRSAAEAFFNDVRQHSGKNATLRERLMEAFKQHFRISAPTEYGMHGTLVKWFPHNYTFTVSSPALQDFTIRAVLNDGNSYDFLFSL